MAMSSEEFSAKADAIVKRVGRKDAAREQRYQVRYEVDGHISEGTEDGVSEEDVKKKIERVWHGRVKVLKVQLAEPGTRL